jgi:hypothetical protein
MEARIYQQGLLEQTAPKVTPRSPASKDTSIEINTRTKKKKTLTYPSSLFSRKVETTSTKQKEERGPEGRDFRRKRWRPGFSRRSVGPANWLPLRALFESSLLSYPVKPSLSLCSFAMVRVYRR